MKNRIFLKANFLSIVFSILVILLTTGCVSPTEATKPPEEEPRDRFSVQSQSARGTTVSWEGYSQGYLPGEKALFDITIENQTDQQWEGRYCLQLLARQSSQIIASLDQRLFNLEPGTGFSDTLDIQIPEDLEPGSYGLSLVVLHPGDPSVNLVPIQIGETDEERNPNTQQDMDASLEGCPPVKENAEHEQVVQQAIIDLAERLNKSSDQIDVKSVEQVTFSDASLGVPEPGQMYAQVLTPGYVIDLTVEGEMYRYHASQDRVVFVPDGTEEVTK